MEYGRNIILFRLNTNARDINVTLTVCVWGGASRYRLEISWMDSSWKNSRRVFFSELYPLVKLQAFEKQGMKFCKCSISKIIKTRNLKLASADRG